MEKDFDEKKEELTGEPLEEPQITEPQPQDSKPRKKSKKEQGKEDSLIFGNYIVLIVGALITFLVFPYVRSLIPALDWWLNIDRFLEFGVLYFLIVAVLSTVEWLVYIVVAISLVILTVGTIKEDGYGFKEVANDYLVMYHNIKSKTDYSPNFPQKRRNKYVSVMDTSIIYSFFFEDLQTSFKNAVNYRDSVVRNYAVRQTTNSPFRECAQEQRDEKMKRIVHAFAVFKSVESQWNYVFDPRGKNYLAKASETIQNCSNNMFCGDCDDHAITLSACMMAVGAKARIVLAKKHAYPELFIGSRENAEKANYLIEKLFEEEIKSNEALHGSSREFCFHTDDKGNYWLNMDYTAPYPGGHFMNDDQTYIDIINL